MTSTAKLKAAAERQKSILAYIASYEPGDIDSDTVDLRFEDENGCDTGCDVSIVEECRRSADLVGELIAALEAAEKRVVELEQSEYQLIKERDYAEAALADMYKAATGEAPELSNWFGYADAVDAVEGRIAELERRVGAAGINLETGGEA